MPFDIGAIGASAANTAINTGMGLLLEGHNDRRQLRQEARLQGQQMDNQRQMTDYNMAKQLQMWKDTNYSAQVEQLQKAGLNPGLLYGMSGGGGVTTGQASGQAQGGNAPKGGGEIIAQQGMGIQSMAQLALLKAQKDNIEADTENKKADLPVKAASIPKIEAETQSILQGITNQEAQEKLIRVETEIKQVEASIARQTIMDAMKSIENLAKKGTEEISLLKISQDEKTQAIKNMKAEVAHMAIKNALMRAQESNTNQDTKNKIQEILESEQRMKTMSGQLALAWDRLGYDNDHFREDQENRFGDEWKPIKDMIPTFLIPIGKGFTGGHTPVGGFKPGGR